MKKTFSDWLVAGCVVLIVPFLMTLIINGRRSNTKSSISEIKTGRDVLISMNGTNRLIDVEEYVAAVLPGEIEPNVSNKLIEAQAVAIRTKIYYAMKDKMVIDASTLDYKYYDDAAYISRWGRENYQSIRSIYEQAVLNTVGEVME